jgi:hypothetical protein
MDGLGRAVGDGVTGLVSGAFDTIGGTIRFIVSSASAAVPGGWLPVIVFVLLAGGAWALAKR